MPITGRTPQECVDEFLAHVSVLASKMLTSRYQMRCPRGPKHDRNPPRTLRFENPTARNAIPLKTREHGTIYLYMAQHLTTEPDPNGYVLRTKKYEYKIYERPPTIDDDDAIVRWEYASANKVHDTHCRHHVQFGKMVKPYPVGDSTFDFTRFHMPTGWVTMEEICRFLVCEFGIEPPCGADWPNVLAAGEDHFYNKATDRGAAGRNRGE
jgi:hypothetical protein